jgi:hypothetical protein
MATVTLTTRIKLSLVALAASWFVCGIATGLHVRNPAISLLVLFWSVPWFAAGWMFMGIPMLAMGNLILRIPTIILGIAGAMAGVFVLLFLPMLEWVLDVMKPVPGVTHSIDLPWSYLKGWPVFCAALGVGGAMLYRWLLSRASTPNE